MSNSHPPLDETQIAKERSRQAAGLKVVIGFLLLAAVIVGGFLTSLPLPVRLMVAATDVVVATVLFLVVRQKFSGK
ncbi:MAG: hypothetical protein ABIZ04_20000 [Opitutus sp.]